MIIGIFRISLAARSQTDANMNISLFFLFSCFPHSTLVHSSRLFHKMEEENLTAILYFLNFKPHLYWSVCIHFNSNSKFDVWWLSDEFHSHHLQRNSSIYLSLSVRISSIKFTFLSNLNSIDHHENILSN